MISDPDLGFSTLEKVCEYSEFPNADSLTRRLKKLISLIVRHEKTHKGFNFENTENFDTIMKEFSLDETRLLFEFVLNQGVHVGSDLRPNWNELRDQFYKMHPTLIPKNVSLIERMVQQFRMIVLKMLHVNLATDSQKSILEAQE